MKLLLVAAVALLCCHNDPPTPTLGADVPQSAMAAAEPQADDVSKLYTVKKDDDVAGLNRKIDIVLLKRQKQATLEAICNRLHDADAHQHETTFINFDVRGEPKPPQFAHWSIARFEPKLSVQILGDE